MNEIEDIVLEAKIRYKEIITVLQDKQDRLKKQIPNDIKIVSIDDELLIELASLKGFEKIVNLANRYKEELLKQTQLYLDIEHEKFSKSEMQIIIHKHAKAVHETRGLGQQLFKELFGDNKRFHLLDGKTIGDNTQFTVE